MTNPVDVNCDNREAVIVTVNRNLNTPVFEQLLYNKTIPETTDIDASVIDVRATDDDRIVRTVIFLSTA